MGIKIGNIDASYYKIGSSDCSIYLGTTKLYPLSPPTPSYTLLQGIERKAGYLGYVDLGLKVGIDFVIEITLNYKKAGGGRFFGDGSTFRWFMAGSTVYFDYNGNRISRTASTSYPLNTDYTVTLRNYSMKSSLNSVVTSGATQTSYDAPATVCIFSNNLQSNGDLAIIYNVKIYTNNGNTLIGDFIPVKRNSDNLVTMFNTVANTFCDAYGSLYPVEINS